MTDPSNAAIADLFDELGDLYELDGAVVHRVLAYRNGAKSVREAPRSVAAMTREGKVTELPGIGRTLEEKIEALLETGTIPAVEKLRARIPAGLVDMTRLPGLGPKRARKLYDELGIDSCIVLFPMMTTSPGSSGASTTRCAPSADPLSIGANQPSAAFLCSAISSGA